MDKKDSKSNKLAGIAFGEAFNSSASSTRDQTIDSLIAAFEDSAEIDEDGVEFWYARDLQRLLGYSEYRNFLPTVAKARETCKASGQPVENHFVDVNEMVEIGSGAEREIDNIRLTRYASYLVAQNGDSRKKTIAFAQTYFAIQTRRQEIQDDDVEQYVPLSEDHKRVLLRDEIKEHNKKLASAAKSAGVIQPIDFAIFQTFGYKGLYGGLDRTGIQRKKGLKAKENILDHMGSTELAANLFRATQTEEKLRRDKLRDKDLANNAHFEVGHKVRQAIRDIGGTMPESLPRAESITKVAKRVKNAVNIAIKSTSKDS
ncbi:MAG: DNA damage-inducible protein D [Acidobacteriaceae bacterium]